MKVWAILWIALAVLSQSKILFEASDAFVYLCVICATIWIVGAQIVDELRK